MGESPEGHSGIHFANQDPVFKMEVIDTSKKQQLNIISSWLFPTQRS